MEVYLVCNAKMISNVYKVCKASKVCNADNAIKVFKLINANNVCYDNTCLYSLQSLFLSSSSTTNNEITNLSLTQGISFL